MDYYKILNKYEKHYSMEYHIGLNTDIYPFNPSGDCESGGIYFAKEDILAFLGIRGDTWIRKVTLPEMEGIYRNPGNPIKYKAHRVILGKREKITAATIKKLIDGGADVHAGNDWALRWASERGHTEIVELLFKSGANVHADNDAALRWTSEKGHTEVVRLLLENGADVHAENDCALRYASRNSHTEVVRLLLENGANVRADNNDALRWATVYSHTKVIKLLLENGAHATN